MYISFWRNIRMSSLDFLSYIVKMYKWSNSTVFKQFYIYLLILLNTIYNVLSIIRFSLPVLRRAYKKNTVLRVKLPIRDANKPCRRYIPFKKIIYFLLCFATIILLIYLLIAWLNIWTAPFLLSICTFLWLCVWSMKRII